MRSLTLADIMGLVLGFGILIPVVAQTTTRSAELRNRSVCAANLRGTTQSMNVYAADNNDHYPMLSSYNSATTYDVVLKRDEGFTDAEKTINALYSQKKYPNNPMAHMWIMVLTGQVAPKQFICPSDINGTPAAVTRKTLDGDEYAFNFEGGKNIGYSVPFPWTETREKKVVVSKLWVNETDASLPVMTDMAPYLGRKAKAGEAATRPAGTREDAAIDDAWAVQKANSSNHDFEGQNVGFSDAHAEFVRDPRVGQGNESIWGIREKTDDKKEIPIEAGTLPHAPGGAPGQWDVIMVPTRDSTGNLK